MTTTHDTRAVVAGLDGSASARRAVRWAAAEAVRRHAPLLVVTAFSFPENALAGRQHLSTRVRESFLADARGRLATAVAAAQVDHPGLEVTGELVLTHPVTALANAAGSRQLVVVGDRGMGGVAGLLLGSVAAALAAHAECPVVVVRGEDPVPSGGPVVVGVDGSSSSEAALAFAFEAAASNAAPLLAVHAWWDLVLAPVLVVPVIDLAPAQEEESEVLAERLAGWGEKYPEVTVTRQVVRGRAAPVLLDAARDAALLVVGSRGRGEIASLLGSVSHAALHHAPCPVALVRPETASG